MRLAKVRLGIVEYVSLAGVPIVAGLVALGLRSGWIIAIVPGLTYVLGIGAVSLLYRQYQREKALGWQAIPAAVAGREQHIPAAQVARAAAFRVVGVRGECPLGRRVGEVVLVESGGEVAPVVCPYAHATLRLAVADESRDGVKEWCCPVYDHLLVFRREPQVA